MRVALFSGGRIAGVLIFSCIYIIASEGFTYADDRSVANKSREWFWFNLGISPEISPAGGIVVSGQRGAQLISARFIDGIDPSGSDWSLWEAGVLYGKSAKSRRGLASIAAGVGAIGGNEPRLLLCPPCRPASPRPSTTIGLPLEVQLFWTPTSILGLGLYFFGNLNAENSFVSALLAVQFGRLR